eukprot:6200876-Pleurochrysis_carterae.AAC.3
MNAWSPNVRMRLSEISKLPRTFKCSLVQGSAVLHRRGIGLQGRKPKGKHRRVEAFHVATLVHKNFHSCLI